MQIIARHIIPIALAALLLCGARVLVHHASSGPAEQSTKPQVRSEALAIDAERSRPQCRIYFGCSPAPRVAAAAIQQ
jgi:hypothetical protein